MTKHMTVKQQILVKCFKQVQQ